MKKQGLFKGIREIVYMTHIIVSRLGFKVKPLEQIEKEASDEMKLLEKTPICCRKSVQLPKTKYVISKKEVKK